MDYGSFEAKKCHRQPSSSPFAQRRISVLFHLMNRREEAFVLTPAEFLVIFPGPPGPAQHVSDSLWRAEAGKEGDLASGLRELFPLDRKSLDDTVKAFDAR
jgi:hypothetical protein